MGGTVGIAIGQSLYTSILKHKINKIPSLSGFDTSPGALSESVRTLKNLPVGDTAEILVLSCWTRHFCSNLNGERLFTLIRNPSLQYGSLIRLLLE